MISRILVILFSLVSLSVYAADCPYPKKPVNWILRYCAMHVESDDEILIHDSACFKQAKKDIDSAEVCQTNEKYKSKICDEFLMESHKYQTKDDCMADTEITPYISG